MSTPQPKANDCDYDSKDTKTKFLRLIHVVLKLHPSNDPTIYHIRKLCLDSQLFSENELKNLFQRHICAHQLDLFRVISLGAQPDNKRFCLLTLCALQRLREEVVTKDMFLKHLKHLKCNSDEGIRYATKNFDRNPAEAIVWYWYPFISELFDKASKDSSQIQWKVTLAEFFKHVSHSVLYDSDVDKMQKLCHASTLLEQQVITEEVFKVALLTRMKQCSNEFYDAVEQFHQEPMLAVVEKTPELLSLKGKN